MFLKRLNGKMSDIHITIIMILLFCCIHGCRNECERTVREQLLSLPYDRFDQTPGSGWRTLAEKHQYLNAARLIEDYLKRFPNLPDDQQTILHFHAAQAFAFGEKTSFALQHLEQSYLASEIPNSPVRWNDYVSATKAFLMGDTAGLLVARDHMAHPSSSAQTDPNLKIVDAFIAHPGESYAVAYLAANQ